MLNIIVIFTQKVADGEKPSALCNMCSALYVILNEVKYLWDSSASVRMTKEVKPKIRNKNSQVKLLDKQIKIIYYNVKR